MFVAIFTAEEFDGVGNKGSGNTTTVGGQTTVEANMSLKSACLTDDALSGQKRNFQSWDHSQVWDYQNFQTSDVALTLCRSNLKPYCKGRKAALFQQAFKFTYYTRNRSPLQEKKS